MSHLLIFRHDPYFRKHNLKETLHRCQSSLGLFYQKLEHFERALKFIDDSLVTVKSMKNKVFECEYLISKGHILLLMENLTESRHVFKKACFCKTPVQEDVKTAHLKFKRTSEICKLLSKLSIENSVQEIDCRTEENSIDPRLEICDKLGDLFADLEAYKVAVKYYEKELDLALDLKCNSSILAPIYVSLAQTHLDQKNYDQALDYFNKELELRSGNLIEATRTSLKIIETKIAMKCGVPEIIDLYEETLDRFKDDICRVRILRDYSSYLHQENETDRARKVDDQLATLSIHDLLDDINQEEPMDVNDNPEINDFEDISSLSSSSEDEEAKDSKAALGDRTKRKVAKKFKTNELGETLLHRACIEGNTKEVTRLLSKGHPVNQRDHCGWLPIHEACNFGYAEIARLLIDAGADINDPGGSNCGGTTPLHDSCSNCVPDVIRLLIERGSDVTKLDNDGNTAIDCLKGWRKRVKELSPEEEDIYKELVQKLEAEMKKKGFDAVAEERRPIIQSSSIQDNDDPKRRGWISGSRSARRQIVHSPTSSPPRKKLTNTRSYDGNDLDRNYEDPEVARLEYQSVISNLRRQRTEISPDNIAEDENLQCTKPSSSSHPPLVNESERIDDWLEDDMGTSSHRSRIILDLYNSKSLPKNERKINQLKKKNVGSEKMRKGSSPTRNVTSLNEENDLLQVSNDDDTFRRNDGESDDDGSVEFVSSSSTVLGNDGRREGGGGGGRVLDERRNEVHESNEKTKTLIKVCLESKSFLISLPDKDGTISWLIQETVSRYYNLEKKKPIIYLTTKDGSLLSPNDLILDVVIDGEVEAHIKSFDYLSSEAGYQEMCRTNQVKPIGAMDQVLKISETNGNLNLSNVSIPQFHLKILADSIKSSDKITCLDFSFTRFTHSSARLTSKSGTAVIPCILDLVCKLPRLKELRLQGLGISSKDLDRFFTAQNTPLQITLLDLSYNSLRKSSLESFVSFVKSLPPSLHTLCLIACNLDPTIFQDPRMIQTLTVGSSSSDPNSPNSKIHQVMVDDSIYEVTKQLYQNQCLKTHKWKKIHRI